MSRGLATNGANARKTKRHFGQSQHQLLPDLRYSPLTDQTLCTWLLDQLTREMAGDRLTIDLDGSARAEARRPDQVGRSDR